MKQISNVFDKNLTYEALYNSYIHSKKGKSLKKNVITYSLKYEFYLNDTFEKLKNGNYNFGMYNKFIVYEPKERIILSAPFRDRVVHTWIVNYFLEPYFVPMFISTSYACIKNKGMHKCALDVKRAMYNVSRKWKNAYVIKMDVSKFFYSIDRKILYSIICKKIKDEKLLSLIRKVIDIPKVYGLNDGKGLPIGNYTSQIFANIYLNEIDQYIKNILKVKFYYRYMDDSIILVEHKSEAKKILEKIKEYLEENLKLKLNSKTNIFKSTQGVNFCGYKINEYRLKIRSKGKKKLKNKIKY